MEKICDREIFETRFPGLHYFRKRMNTKTEKSYNSHVFFTEPMDNSTLSSEWKNITSIIAVEYQSVTDELVERSNYYICFYVEDQVDEKLCAIIEGDEFCARKYIITNKYPGEEQAVNEITEKLFGFAQQEVVNPIKNPIHMSSLTLHNFRIYENSKPLEFIYYNKKNRQIKESSSFVLIYAKNGVGKTTIFDGVEYLLKGEIERIKNIEENNRVIGNPKIVYHNFKHANEESFISAVLSNDEVLERSIETTQNGELMRSNPRKGASFIGTDIDRENWKEIILPHDCIEGFVSATKPDELYNEWIRNSNLKRESERFLNTHKESSSSRKEINSLMIEYGKARNRLKDLKQSLNDVKRILSLIEQFNDIKRSTEFPQGEELQLSMSNELDSYIRLIDDANGYLRYVENELSVQVLPAKKNLNEICDNGLLYYDKKHLEFLDTEKRIDALNKQKKDRIQFDEINIRLNTALKKKKECEDEINSIKTVIDIGGEKLVREKSNRIHELQQQYQIIQTDLNAITQSVGKLEERYVSISGSVRAIELILNDNDRYKEYITTAEKYVTEKSILSSLRIGKEQFRSETNNLLRIIDNCREKIRKLEMINFPDRLSELNLDMIMECGDLIGRENVKSLLVILDNYVKLNAAVDLISKQVELNEKKEDEYGHLITLANSYVAKHPNLSECPVCGKHFRNNKKLCEAIENLYSQQYEELIEALNLNRYKIVELDKNYEVEIILVKKEVLKTIKKLKEESIDASKCLSSRSRDKGEIDKQYEETKSRLEESALLLQQFDNYNDDPVDAIEKWYAIKRSELEILRSQMVKTQELLSKADSDAHNNRERLSRIKQELNQLKEDYLLQKSISYISHKDEKWSAMSSLLEMQDELVKINPVIDEYFDALKQLNEVREIDLDYCLEQIKKSENELKLLQKEESIYKQYFLGPKSIEEEIGELTKKEEVLRKQIDLLRGIVEENGAKQYFNDYNDATQRIEEILDKIKNERKKARSNREEERILKNQLEGDLEEYVNQTVMNSLYRKLDPHRVMKNVKYTIEFSKEDKPLLYISVTNEKREEIRPEWYFSTAQLNTLVFSSFFSRALSSKLPLKTIFIDDPIAHFDDINILSFADLMRCLIMETPYQFIMSTHDKKIYNIMKRKLPVEYYKTKFIEL